MSQVDPRRAAFIERTALAWQRTGLAALITSAIAAKAAQAAGSVVGLVLCAATAGLSLVVVLRAQRRPPGGIDAPTTRWRLMGAVALVVLCLAAAGIALAIG